MEAYAALYLVRIVAMHVSLATASQTWLWVSRRTLATDQGGVLVGHNTQAETEDGTDPRGN